MLREHLPDNSTHSLGGRGLDLLCALRYGVGKMPCSEGRWQPRMRSAIVPHPLDQQLNQAVTRHERGCTQWQTRQVLPLRQLSCIDQVWSAQIIFKGQTEQHSSFIDVYEVMSRRAIERYGLISEKLWQGFNYLFFPRSSCTPFQLIDGNDNPG